MSADLFDLMFPADPPESSPEPPPAPEPASREAEADLFPAEPQTAPQAREPEGWLHYYPEKSGRPLVPVYDVKPYDYGHVSFTWDRDHDQHVAARSRVDPA